jgi:3-methyladenine DNA glycosylase AlkD
MATMTAKKIIAGLKEQGNQENREGMARFGIVTENALGVGMVPLRDLAKTIKKNSPLAKDLWKSGIHEARILACLIEDPKEVTEEQMEEWVKEFNSWDLCDQCCMNLFRKTKLAHKKAHEWAKREEEYIRRAGFALMATLSVHDKCDDAEIEKFLEPIVKASTDERNFVKKAVNWALRQVGKRNMFLREKALEASEEILKLNSKSGNWIAKDAVKELNDPKIIERKEITLRYSRVTKILGYEISKEKIHQILSRLGLALKDLDENLLLASVPTFRPDIEREIDLIEEIARINGYDNIPVVPKINITLEKKVDQQKFEDDVRNIISSFGFYEMINNPLESEWEARLTGNPIFLANPQSAEMSCLRTSLFAGGLNSVKRNLNFGIRNMMLFEIGNVFEKKSDLLINTFDDISEKQNLILILSGKEEEKTWYSDEKFFDFYSLKGFVNSYTQKISLDNQLTDLYYSSENEIYSYYFTKNFNNQVVGVGGKVKKDVLSKFDINQDVFVFEFDLSALKKIAPDVKKYIEPPKFPKIIRDFAFVFDKSVQYLDVKNFILEKASKLLKKVELFDIFESETLGGNKKSMAFTLEYFDESRTLTEDEVEKDFNYLISEISKKFNAKLRG